jgi:type I restriction enzyme S subunit
MSHYKPYPAYKDSGVEWLDAIPDNWEISRLGFEAWVRARLGWKGLKAEEYVDDGYAFLSTPDIKGTEIDFSDVNFITEERYEESPEIKLAVGDVLLAKDGSTLGTVNVVRKLPRAATVNSSIAVITPFQRLTSLYLYYLFKCSYLENTIQVLKGGMGVPHLFQWDINKFKIPLPGMLEQAEIAAHLDLETARIDALIEKKTRFIELLREKRQALITHAVTKGLDPNVKMKDSGVEWLGEVPEHWKVKKLKYLLKPNGLVRGPFGGDLKKEIFVDDGVKVYEQKNAIYQSVELGASFVTAEKFSEMLRFEVRPGDYIMSCSGTIGRTYRVPEGAPIGIINQALLIIRFDTGVSSEFADWIFVADFFVAQILDNSQGGAMKNLVGMDIFTSILLQLPPLDEQRSIASYLLVESKRIDSLIAKSERSVDLLKERRSALITAAVTGQIDLREVV